MLLLLNLKDICKVILKTGKTWVARYKKLQPQTLSTSRSFRILNTWQTFNIIIVAICSFVIAFSPYAINTIIIKQDIGIALTLELFIAALPSRIFNTSQKRLTCITFHATYAVIAPITLILTKKRFLV